MRPHPHSHTPALVRAEIRNAANLGRVFLLHPLEQFEISGMKIEPIMRFGDRLGVRGMRSWGRVRHASAQQAISQLPLFVGGDMSRPDLGYAQSGRSFARSSSCSRRRPSVNSNVGSLVSAIALGSAT